ncbi:YlxR family protein [Angustibacter aerolatus]
MAGRARLSPSEHTARSPGTVPQRTCVGCRQRGDRTVLLRFVAVRAPDGLPGFVVVHDPRRSMPGRGAWLHPDLDCVALAVRRPAFTRALRCAGPLDVSGTSDLVRALVTQSRPTAEPGPGPGHPRHHRPSAVARSTESGSDADEHPMSPQR